MEQRVANKKDVWHLVQRGELTQLHFDFEGYGLNTKFAQIMSYGDAVGDLAGNFAGSDELHVKRPDRYVPGPQALTVTRTSPHDLDEEGRLPHRVAMAKIAKRFEDNLLAAARFGVREESRDIQTVRKYGEDVYPKDHSEPVIHYPLFDPDRKMEINAQGEIVTDPPGMLKLNRKGEVVIGPEEKVVTIPKKVGTKWDAQEKREVPVYEYKPMKPSDGAITFDVRIHPRRNMIAYRFEDDTRSPYYENIENNYYRDGGEGKWKFSDPRLLISGYRIKWYDIPLLRSNLVRAGFHPSNIFFTHSKATISSKQKPKNFSVDGYSVAVNTHLFGPQGEHGLKIGSRTDSRTGENVPSAKLELIMAANTRYENKARGVRAGVFMPDDGSAYDGRKGHKSPAYDAKASFAAYNYCREIAPDIVRQQELQSDEDYLREMMPGMDLTEPHPPLFATMRSSYPDSPVADPVAFVGFDDQQGQLRRAIMVRMDLGDLRNFTYKGKTLIQMAEEDLRQSDPAKRNFLRMLKEQGRSPDSLIRVDSLRKFHGVVRLHEAQHTEAAKNWDREQIDENFRFLVDEENGRVLEAIRDAVEIMNWEMRQEALPPNPRLEEEWPYNGFGDIDYLEYEARQDMVKQKRLPGSGQTRSVTQMLYEKAMDVFKYHNSVDELLHRLVIQAHPVDLYGYDDTLDAREAVRNYWELFKKVHDRLDKKDCPYVHIFDEFSLGKKKLSFPGQTRGRVENGENANGTAKYKSKILTVDEMSEEQLQRAIEKIQEYRWDMMKRMLNDDEAERRDRRSDYGKGLFDHKCSKKGRLLFGNLTRDFRIIDERGRELSIDYLKRQYNHQPHMLQEKLDSKEWRIQFYRQTSEPTTSVILMQFADMGRMDELPPLWQFRYQALRSLYLYGPPNEEPDNMRWDAIPVLERALLAMEVNNPIDFKGGLARVFSQHVAGEAEIFLRSEEGQRFLGEYKAYLEQIKTDCPRLASPQYDDATGVPYDWIEHEIDAGDYVTIEVPDAHLRSPLEDLRQSPYSLVIPTIDEEDKARIRRGTPVVLRGMQTGRLYHPGPVSLRQAPPENASYAEYYEDARRAYQDEAGVAFPRQGERDVLRIQGLIPVANSRAVAPAMQSLKIPAQHFDGLVCPRLAYFNENQPLTGLVLPADYCPQALTAGKPIRFREMKAVMGSKMHGTEGLETGHVYETQLTGVRRMTVGALLEEVRGGRLTDDIARRCGYAGAHDLWEKVNDAFLGRESPDPMSEEILLLEFKPIDKETWAYFNPPDAPKAAFIHDGKPLPPSAYRNDSNAPVKTPQGPAPKQ